jgi:hypothetical protein
MSLNPNPTYCNGRGGASKLDAVCEVGYGGQGAGGGAAREQGRPALLIVSSVKNMSPKGLAKSVLQEGGWSNLVVEELPSCETYFFHSSPAMSWVSTSWSLPIEELSGWCRRSRHRRFGCRRPVPLFLRCRFCSMHGRPGRRRLGASSATLLWPRQRVGLLASTGLEDSF